ncbi:MAG TPA: amino acid permease [Gemmatimonadales bacterium]|nr:amino acid permease [Gemmatimonadales bacterium]
MDSSVKQGTEFRQAITRLDATALVAGTMIGSGIFIVSADILRQVHTPGVLLLVWALSGVITLMGALSYGELAAMFPKAGGQYVYLREGVSPLFGYLYGWTLFTVIQTGTIAAVAVAFARFTAIFFSGLSPDVWFGTTVNLGSGPISVGVSPQRLLAIVSVIALTWINVRGVRAGALIQTTLTGVKTLSLAALVILGLLIGRNAAAIAANFSGGHFWGTQGLTLALLPIIGSAMVGSLFSMDSWNNVGFAGSELKDPKRDLPISMALGTLTVTVLYLLANVAYLVTLPSDAIAHAPQDRVGTAALQAMFGDPGLYLMAGAIMISTFGCNNGLILSGARVFYAMAKDGLFFARAGTLHPTYRTPRFALVLQAIWTSVLCLSGTYNELLTYVIAAQLLFYAFTALGLFMLRKNRPDAERPVRAPGYPWIPGLYLVSTLVLCIDLLFTQTKYAGIGLIIVALGVPVYFLSKGSGAGGQVSGTA